MVLVGGGEAEQARNSKSAAAGPPRNNSSTDFQNANISVQLDVSFKTCMKSA